MLEEEEYLRRKEYYQESGQRHYYFMNIGNGEVIDAARKASSSPCLCLSEAVSNLDLDQRLSGICAMI